MVADRRFAHVELFRKFTSRHVTLKTAGLVTDERHGQNIIYSLNTTVMQDLIGWFMGFMDGDGNVNQANDQTDNK